MERFGIFHSQVRKWVAWICRLFLLRFEIGERFFYTGSSGIAATSAAGKTVVASAGQFERTDGVSKI